MYKHILIATDGSELAGKAVATGLALAKELGAKVTAVTATEPWTTMVTAEPAFVFPVTELEEAAADGASRTLAKIAAVANVMGVACSTMHVKDFPAEGIIATATANGCDLIVMSSHGRRGLSRALLGSQALSVLTHTTIPVLICR